MRSFIIISSLLLSLQVKAQSKAQTQKRIEIAKQKKQKQVLQQLALQEVEELFGRKVRNDITHIILGEVTRHSVLIYSIADTYLIGDNYECIIKYGYSRVYDVDCIHSATEELLPKKKSKKKTSRRKIGRSSLKEPSR